MDMVTAIEDACIQRLGAALQLLDMPVLPGPPTRRETAAWLAYRGSRLGRRQGTAQWRTLRFELQLSASELRTDKGLYAQLAAVYRCLLGFRPVGAEPCRRVRDSRIQQGQDGWRCKVHLACRVLAVAQLDGEAAPSLTVVNHEEGA
ncbi:DUF1834 family protein [Chromobacterium subtsugae]|uniref:DUF1834 family protein n=2 Tax=Chromobacteriaceae TaxID=1499392 RepID=A0ABS7FJR3_9NEIS|nr:hypothetical protein Cv017_22655 [Chromobacterium subtsugae]KZE84139.1 hypothetical protein AWB61_05415 [Chromobacterium sp. F49]MBW7568664.1 hypothetical protein [Chromobacterium subtsugae]MBW8290330.1 DUF1834 family protein [Chromobacterium subtsugae]OBU86003.1 hypothetical protein MY55_13150 [Chromobacterium subtsugae]